MGDVKLLPCPFCGAEATLQYNRVGGAHIFCSNQAAIVDCETESPTEADNDETFAAWNERTAPALTPKQAAADEMAKALAVLDSFWDFGEPVLPNTAITYENPDGINAAMIQARAARKAWDALAKAGQP